MQKWNENRFLFITANPGYGGHRLGRIVSCLDNVHWYSHPMNGENPWDTPGVNDATPDFLKECIKISKYHYHRVLIDEESGENRYIPHIGERVFKRWKNMDEWKEMFLSRIEDLPEVDEYYVPWLCHVRPDVLAKLFPDSKIINLYSPDPLPWDEATRYLQTTSNFPYYFEFNGQTPSDYVTPYLKDLNEMVAEDSNLTFKEYWRRVNKFTEWDRSIEKRYRNWIIHEIAKRRPYEHHNVLNLKWIDAFDSPSWFLNGTFHERVTEIPPINR